MRVAVTGAGGFIGGHLTSHLNESGHEVLALRRSSAGDTFTAVIPGEPAVADLEDQLRGVDAVVHLAARQQDSPDTPLAAYLPSNVSLTEHLLQKAVAANVSTFVLASSRLVYPSSLSQPAREDCPIPPDNFYGLSKRMAELLAGTYQARYGLRCSALRIAQVFGAGDNGRGVLPRFIETARKGETIRVAGAGVAVRDFVDVRDVARAFRIVLEAAESPALLNIGGGRGYSIAELAATVAEAAGIDGGTIDHIPVENEDTSHFSLDCTLASTELGWRPAQSLLSAVADRLADSSH